MTKLILVRHGESEANIRQTFAGHLDMPLTEKGRAQAGLTADYIQDNYAVDSVYASDLSRAYETGVEIAKRFSLPVQKSTLLREIYSGAWQGKTFDCLQSDFADSYNTWLKDIGNARCPEGETVAELSDRVWSVVSEIVRREEGKTVVIATHATPIRVLQARITGYGLEHLKNVPWVSNASLTEVVVNGDEWLLAKIGEDEYLSSLRTSFPANV